MTHKSLADAPVWLEPGIIDPKRFDTGYYDPALTIAERHFRDSLGNGWQRLRDVARVYNFGAYELTNELHFVDADVPNSVPFITVTNIKRLSIDFGAVPWIDRNSHELLSASSCVPGTVLLSIAGTIGRAAVVPTTHSECNGNQAIAKITVNKDKTDPYFLAAYFATPVGLAASMREAAGAVQKNLYIYNVEELPVPSPPHPIRTAIGNKLRAAERLRQASVAARLRAAEIISDELQWHLLDSSLAEQTAWVQPSELKWRIDSQFNSAGRIAVLRHLQSHDVVTSPLGRLAEISAMVGWKGLTTEFYTSVGPVLVRRLDFQDGVIELDNVVRVAREKYDEQPQIHLRAGDVVIVKDGNGIGIACSVQDLGEELCAGSTLARIRAGESISNYCLEALINHPVVQVQIQSMATGMAQPHITQEWLARLEIPVVGRVAEINAAMETFHSSFVRANSLTKEAIEDAQSLVDGELDEQACLSSGLELSHEFSMEGQNV